MAASGQKRESVRVIVRCRPLSDKERSAGYSEVVEVDVRRRRIGIISEKTDNGIKEFTFDAVYGNDCKQEDLYNESVRPLVEAVLEGFNGTIFAYGQTGTGKTFTMQGIPAQPGIIPRAMEHIFRHIEESKNEHYLVTASYMEIYREDLRDLLKKKEADGGDKKTGDKRKARLDNSQITTPKLTFANLCDPFLQHLSQYQLKSFHHMEKMMERGQNNRAIGATDMNEYSSRSHAIFTVNIECGLIGPDGREHVRVGKLNLVDLAGSEKQSKANSSGDRFKEATQINLSLTTLGMVITSLVEKSPHIPYRDSKLTRLLQDSLGGNSKTIMVANVGPAAYNLEETLSTLRYANRAKNIKNSPHINEDPKDAKMREYLDELSKLRALLASKSANGQSNGLVPEESVEDDPRSDTSENFADEREKIEQERRNLKENSTINNAAKNKLLADFILKEDDLKRREQERRELKSKVEEIEQRMLKGNSRNVQERMAIQSEYIQKQNQEIDAQRRREEAILQALESEQKNAKDFKQTVSIVQSDIDKIVARIERLHHDIEHLNEERKTEEFLAHELNETIGEQVEQQRQRESLLWTTVSHFISPALWEPLTQQAVYDDNEGDWILPNETLDITRPPLFLTLDPDQALDPSFQALQTENILELALDTTHELDLPPTLIDDEGTNEDSGYADLFARTFDEECKENNLVIDADVFTIERPRTRNSAVEVDKENYGRPSSRFRNAPVSTPLPATPGGTRIK